MVLTFTVTRFGMREIRTHNVRDLEEARAIAAGYALDGYTVLVRDQETGREYWLRSDGSLQRIP